VPARPTLSPEVALTLPRRDDLMIAAQHALDRAKHPRLVVDDENAGGPHAGCGCGCATAAGTRMRTSVPRPGSL